MKNKILPYPSCGFLYAFSFLLILNLSHFNGVNAYTELEDGLFAHQTDSYLDGTMVVRMSKLSQDKNCVEPRIQFRVLFPNKTLAIWELQAPIPEFNFCQDTINFWVLQQDYILVSYLNSTGNENNEKYVVQGIGLSWTGKIYESSIRFGYTSELANVPKGGLAIRGQKNNSFHLWTHINEAKNIYYKRFSISDHMMSVQDTTDIIDLQNVISYNAFPLKIGGFGFVVTTKDCLQKNLWNIYDLFLEAGAAKTGDPLLLDSIQSNNISSHSISCRDEFPGETYGCVLGVKNSSDDSTTYSYMKRGYKNESQVFPMSPAYETVRIFTGLSSKYYLVANYSDQTFQYTIETSQGNATTLSDIPTNCTAPNIMENNTLWCVFPRNRKYWEIISKDLSSIHDGEILHCDVIKPSIEIIKFKFFECLVGSLSGSPIIYSDALTTQLGGETDSKNGKFIGFWIAIFIASISVLVLTFLTIRRIIKRVKKSSNNYLKNPWTTEVDTISLINSPIGTQKSKIPIIHPFWIRSLIHDGILEFFDQDDFVDRDFLGGGSYGLVSKAIWISRKTSIALKHIPNTSPASFNENNTLAKEVQILLRVVNHPNTIRFYGLTMNPSNQDYCLVLHYANGGSLRTYLNDQFEFLSWQDKFTFAIDVTSGLKFLHENGILHLDLHSQNVLIHNGVALLTDFGLSKVMEIDMTMPYSVHGVIPFMDPQRLQNKRYPHDHRSDVYGLGVILWEISSGYVPFLHRAGDNDLIASIINGEREKPTNDSPPEYVTLYQQCWDKEPALRPTISSIAEQLENMRTNSVNYGHETLRDSYGTSKISRTPSSIQCEISMTKEENKSSTKSIV
ncbi:hypothetical protein G9A89_016926 [Geosiphon pyriformis]|nr:hypothetical protein G9A89_016926 [Geosiphon pyriformis]